MIHEIDSIGFLITIITLTILSIVIIALIHIHKTKQLGFIKEIRTIGLETKKSTCKYISREIHDNILQKLTTSYEILRCLKPQDNSTKEKLFISIDQLSISMKWLHEVSVMLSNYKISSRTLLDLIEEELKILRLLDYNVV